ncbi:hypothetical protein C8J56DRAFT_880980 [Mycena floridula]|nr:hypothetical protein C8J56DRAFT_880980 [Mycena floridula]
MTLCCDRIELRLIRDNKESRGTCILKPLESIQRRATDSRTLEECNATTGCRKYHLGPLAEQAAQSDAVADLLQNGAFLHKDGERFRAPIIKDALEVLDQRLKVELE